MKVLKFGGSSVKNATNILKVYEILKTQFHKNGEYTVVVSAFGGVTDELIKISTLASKGNKRYVRIFLKLKERHLATAKELLNAKWYKIASKHLNESFHSLEKVLNGIFLVQELTLKTKDYVLSFGERSSAYIIACALSQRGIESEFLDAREIITTDKKFGNATVNFSLTGKKIKALYKDSTKVKIVTGFISADKGGLTTTLGRGGSDYTAAILANALNAKVLEIWTDVDGILTGNPNKVKQAFTINNLSYREAMELSHMGAKVIYPPTIKPALNKNIPIKIRNTFNPSFSGSIIAKASKNSDFHEITGLSSISGISLLNLHGSGMIDITGIHTRLFSALSREEIDVLFITKGSSEYSICFAIHTDQRKKTEGIIQKTFENELNKKLINEVSIKDEMSMIAIVSEQMRTQPGVAGKLFGSLGREGINVTAIAQGSSELNITFVINTKDEEKALNLIHDSFFLSQNKIIHLYLIGVGLIGGTLLEQIQRKTKSLENEDKIQIKLCGISNSEKQLVQPKGISFKTWNKELSKKGVESNSIAFLKEIQNLNLPNSILVDATSSKKIASLYAEALESNISVITPNKLASSGPLSKFEELKQLALKRNVSFLYETNVGAGLPILSTIENLVSSGDEIVELKAVLSGTISYIFNSFSSKIPFSSIVKQAQELGLTEPDPRDDLNGTDVKRKITILARAAGFPVEMSNVAMEQIVKPSVMKAKNVEDFYIKLKGQDAHFEELAKQTEAKGKKLRYIAELKNGKCSVKLVAVKEDDPFYHLQGSDNLLVLYTKRYTERPMIIRGPGAGANVTAAGVFAEIMSVAKKRM